MKESDVRNNAFTENLGTDWVAIDARGNPVCRGHDEDTVRRTMPHAAAWMTTGRFVTPGAPPPEPDEHPARAPDAPEPAAAEEPEPEPAPEPAAGKSRRKNAKA